LSAQYDDIAEDYRATKTSPLRRHIEAHTLFTLIGDVSGLRVLDLACGDGFYTRQLKDRGAAAATGVDISAAMIALAEQEERKASRGIEYLCSAVEDMPDLGTYDLVVAAYLLHYASSRSVLERMCRRIAAHLRPDGRFVAINENPRQSAEQYAGYAQYGFNKRAALPRVDAAPITYSLVAQRRIISFEAYYYSEQTYAECLAVAGFAQAEWHPMRVADAGRAEMGDAYWDEYLENPPVLALECRL